MPITRKEQRLSGVRLKPEVIHAGALEGKKWSRPCPQPKGSILHDDTLPNILYIE